MPRRYIRRHHSHTAQERNDQIREHRRKIAEVAKRRGGDLIYDQIPPARRAGLAAAAKVRREQREEGVPAQIAARLARESAEAAEAAFRAKMKKRAAQKARNHAAAEEAAWEEFAETLRQQTAQG